MIDYEIIKSKRKSIAIQIKDDCSVVVRAPHFVTKKQIESIVKEKENWINSKIFEIKEKQAKKEAVTYTKEEVIQFHRFVLECVEKYAEIMNLNFGKIKFNNAKTRFGSCNTKTHNLNFSYLLLSKPKDAIESVVVHELAHIVYPNHSKAFYDYIEKYMPDYKERSKKLK